MSVSTGCGCQTMRCPRRMLTRRLGLSPCRQVTNPKGALNVARRTWDKEEFARRADEREAAEEAGGAVVDEVKADDDLEKRLYRKAESAAAGPMNSQRAFLKARDFDLRMESRLHRTKVGRWCCVGCACVACRVADAATCVRPGRQPQQQARHVILLLQAVRLQPQGQCGVG